MMMQILTIIIYVVFISRELLNGPITILKFNIHYDYYISSARLPGRLHCLLLRAKRAELLCLCEPHNDKK